MRLLIVLVFPLLFASAFAQVNTYTAANLGYPVPEPVDTATSGTYFRTYAGLRIKLADLALANSFITEHDIGTTRDSRTIYGYVIGDSDGLAVDQTAEPGMLINGTIHAREWASPEINTQLYEHIALNYGTDPIVTYLVDQLHLVMIPVLNVDGFLQTQRFFDSYWGSYRDGRMRRKNMLEVDELITTGVDNYDGVDLNRNFPTGWNNGSSTTSSITFRGPLPLSEPEDQALDGAVGLFESTDQIRAYFDMHGTIPLIYYIVLNNPSVDGVTVDLASRYRLTIKAINNANYSPSSINISSPAGVSDEHFASSYDIPAFTVEYPQPPINSPGIDNSFITPNSQVDGIVQENIYALILGMLFASGPPILERVLIWDDENSDNDIQSSEIVYDAEWTPDGSPATTRSQSVVTNDSLFTGKNYSILLQFNKPMRRGSSTGVPLTWPGVDVVIQPTATVTVNTNSVDVQVVASPEGNGWLFTPMAGETPGFARYGGDTWTGSLDLSSLAAADMFAQAVALDVLVNDLYGHALDAMPSTVVDWDAGWTGYEDSSGAGAVGGMDQSFSISIAPAPTANIQGWMLY